MHFQKTIDKRSLRSFGSPYHVAPQTGQEHSASFLKLSLVNQLKQHRLLFMLALPGLLLLLAWSHAPRNTGYGKLTLTALDVGQGDSLVIEVTVRAELVAVYVQAQDPLTLPQK
jgi:hypothetical protein